MTDQMKKIIEENIDCYNPWWEDKEVFYDRKCRIASEELNQTVLCLADEISIKEAQESDSQRGISIFHYLVWHNFYDAAELLLKKGVNPDVCGISGKEENSRAYLGVTPLHLACYMGNDKIAKLLIDYGADTAISDEYGRNCFHYIAAFYYDNMTAAYTAQLKSLSNRGYIIPLLQCDINQKDKNGMMPLWQLMYEKESKLSQNFTSAFVKLGADMTASDENGNNALMLAAGKNKITAALYLAKCKTIQNLQNKEGDTALHISAKEGNAEISYLLFALGADKTIKNKQGKTAVDIIRENGYKKEMLLCPMEKTRSSYLENLFSVVENAFQNCGSDNNDRFAFALYFAKKLLHEIDMDDDDEFFYVRKLIFAALFSDKECEIFKLIGETGLNFTENACYGTEVWNIRDICLKKVYNIAMDELIQKFAELGVDLNGAYIKGETPANIVAQRERDHSLGVSCLGKVNANRESREEKYAKAAGFFSKESMEQCDHRGMAAIHWAAKNDHVPLMKTMIKKGVNLNLTADFPQEVGTTPLHIACSYVNPEMVKTLMEAGADDSAKNVSGETPAHCVVTNKQSVVNKRGRIRIAVLDCLFDIDIPGNDGRTPAILLQSLGDDMAVEEITMYLLERGIDVEHADNEGNTILLAHVKHRCSKNVIKELLHAGADMNAKDKDGNTSLHYVLQNGNIEVARFLIKKGADYHITNNKGKTSVDIAVEKGYEMVLVLMNEK